MNRLAHLQELLKENPKDTFILYGLGLEYLSTEPEKSRDFFEKILQIDTNYLAVYYQLGKLYEKLNFTDEAKNTFEKGIQIAIKQKNNHTKNELSSALNLLITPTDADDEGDDW